MRTVSLPFWHLSSFGFEAILVFSTAREATGFISLESVSRRFPRWVRRQVKAGSMGDSREHWLLRQLWPLPCPSQPCVTGPILLTSFIILCRQNPRWCVNRLKVTFLKEDTRKTISSLLSCDSRVEHRTKVFIGKSLYAYFYCSIVVFVDPKTWY